MLSLVPFDIDTIDSGLGGSDGGAATLRGSGGTGGSDGALGAKATAAPVAAVGDRQADLVGTILSLGMKHLGDAGPTRCVCVSVCRVSCRAESVVPCQTWILVFDAPAAMWWCGGDFRCDWSSWPAGNLMEKRGKQRQGKIPRVSSTFGMEGSGVSRIVPSCGCYCGVRTRRATLRRRRTGRRLPSAPWNSFCFFVCRHARNALKFARFTENPP